MARNDYDYLFKILLVGSSSDKSRMILHFTENNFSDSYLSTIGVDFKIRKVELDGKYLKLQIWDTAGQERFRSITTSYYRGSQGIIIIYDITNRESFEYASKIISYDISQYAPKNVSLYLVGNIPDTNERRVVQREAHEFGIPFIETCVTQHQNAR